MMKSNSRLFIFAAVALMACSSKPTVSELPNTADPNQELSRVEDNFKAAEERQANVLSPTNFDKAMKSLETAREYRSQNKPQKEVLRQIALSQAYLDKADAVTVRANEVLPQVILQRQNAIKAEVPKYYSKEFGEVDDDLRDATEDLESNSTSEANQAKASLADRYNKLELQAIVKTRLGDARSKVDQATREGARKLTPDTLVWAHKKINNDERIIVSDRHNSESVEKASQDANQAAERLLAMVREAKSSAQLTPEQLARRREQNMNAQANSAQAIEAVTAQKDKLESESALEKQYEAAQAEFSDDEAEVYKQGDKLVLRLKGLSFPRDQATISTESYPLLTKVQTVIKNAGSSEIIVEGHTDSTGLRNKNQKLSEARAEAVEEYLKANEAGANMNISSVGFGDTKPLATNKTKVGRAQNRRVDVIIKSSDKITDSSSL